MGWRGTSSVLPGDDLLHMDLLPTSSPPVPLARVTMALEELHCLTEEIR